MLKYWIWLSELQGLSNQDRLALLRRFDTPERLYYADETEILETEGLQTRQAEIFRNRNLSGVNKILERCRRLEIRILTIQDAQYPRRLKQIYDPPLVLYTKGRFPLHDEELTVAAVGTRDCTPYGKLCAERLSAALSQGGARILSGLAKGIDTAAVLGALHAGGHPVGVLVNGIDVYYPRENRRLYEDIMAAGLLISEYPPESRPLGHHFPARSRVLSGLAEAVLVVEAPERSGSLMTVERAIEQGRDVFAVPGSIYAPQSAGCNRLIQDGAGLICEAEDLLQAYRERFSLQIVHEEQIDSEPIQEISHTVPEKETRSLPQLDKAQAQNLTEDQKTLLRVLSEQDAATVDDLIEKTDLSAGQVLAALTLLEIDQLVAQQSGKRYVRAVTWTE